MLSGNLTSMAMDIFQNNISLYFKHSTQQKTGTRFIHCTEHVQVEAQTWSRRFRRFNIWQMFCLPPLSRPRTYQNSSSIGLVHTNMDPTSLVCHTNSTTFASWLLPRSHEPPDVFSGFVWKRCRVGRRWHHWDGSRPHCSSFYPWKVFEDSLWWFFMRLSWSRSSEFSRMAIAIWLIPFSVRWGPPRNWLNSRLGRLFHHLAFLLEHMNFLGCMVPQP